MVLTAIGYAVNVLRTPKTNNNTEIQETVSIYNNF